MKLRSSPWIRLPLALFAGAVLLALATEATLRIWTPEHIEFEIRSRERPREKLMELDPELGHRPVLGGPEYGPHGAKWNDYPLPKTPGRRRLLFIGDSVTGRSAIVDGLRAELGEERYEWWNAGVDGYSSLEELEYYRRYCAGIQADHVILTFHLNDFVVTPVAFQSGSAVVGTQARTVQWPNAWLWQHCYAYRLYFQWTLERTPAPTPEERTQEVEAALAGLRDLVHERSADFTVLVFPWLRPEDEWPPAMTGRHARALAMLERLGLRHYSFLDDLRQALAEGEVVQEKARDPQHPSAEFGRRIARSLVARGFVP